MGICETEKTDRRVARPACSFPATRFRFSNAASDSGWLARKPREGQFEGTTSDPEAATACKTITKDLTP